VEIPETQYARSGDVNIAYQVTGDGPFDLVFVPGYVTHLELHWSIASFAPFLERLSSFARLIRFDKRGTGMSDRVGGAPTLETRMDDVRAVMDAVGSRRAAFYGLSEGAAMVLLFAATYPERTAALVVRVRPARAGPGGDPRARHLREDSAAESFLQMLRYASSPGSLEALHRMNKEIDVRHVLPAIRVPTLILRGSEDTIVAPEVARYMASRIPAANALELPGVGHLSIGEPGGTLIANEVERFVTDVWEAGGWDETEPDWMLATVLFTDIVGSTAKAIALGDRGWRDLLERHHALIRRELVRFRGAELDVAGDGFFARFDGPARAVRCACAISESMGRLGLQIRAGLHTGECELMGDKVGGIAVHIGARVAQQAQPGEVLVSSTVRDLVAGSGLRFRERGTAELKGIPEEWRLYAVERG
jgi:class 3 adenylate cyclase